MKQREPLFTHGEWVTLTGTLIVTVAVIMVFLFQTFESAGAADKVKTELKVDIRQVERKVDALLLNRGLNPEVYEKE
jgi:low affinity Fe/Cu permease